MHVIVITVPALGLTATELDQREQRRQQLNADPLNGFRNYGADEVIDVAAAVQETANPNQINSAYLTADQPNGAYHNGTVCAHGHCGS